ncbi:MAG: DUF4440 domain-containing protein [Alphaproteobacteria bacterium]
MERDLSLIETWAWAIVWQKMEGSGMKHVSQHSDDADSSEMERAAAIAADSHEPHGESQLLADLIRRSAEGNAALMRGDVSSYRAFIPHSDDFVLMSPFGGAPTHAADYTPERLDAMGRFFKNGTFKQEIVQSYATADMAALVTIERAHVEVGDLPAQDWALRVTLIYRRDGPNWRLVHRHADPLVHGVTLEQAADLAHAAPTPGQEG